MIQSLECGLIGVPTRFGASQSGCQMGPEAFRTAGLAEELQNLGHNVCDQGDVAPLEISDKSHPNPNIHNLTKIVSWAYAIETAAYENCMNGKFPIFLGGDHSLSIGSIAGVAKAAHEQGRELFVLWLDAHPDIHRLETTQSGNLHGTPIAYLTGAPGFEDIYPPLDAPLKPENICMMGIRSVDEAENIHLNDSKIHVFDMRAIDEQGVAQPLRTFLKRVKEANGLLHVSFDVDFLEPDLAPAVGTTVPGGATFREAHLIMEMLSDTQLTTSLDLVELNPFLDERGKTAKLMVDLCASLMGRKVLDRPTRSY